MHSAQCLEGLLLEKGQRNHRSLQASWVILTTTCEDAEGQCYYFFFFFSPQPLNFSNSVEDISGALKIKIPYLFIFQTNIFYSRLCNQCVEFSGNCQENKLVLALLSEYILI